MPHIQRIYSIGQNKYGELGLGTDNLSYFYNTGGAILVPFFGSSSPTQIGTSSWSQVSAGPSHTAAIRSDGRLYTWGLNSSGQLGDGTTVSTSSPLFIAVTAGTPLFLCRIQ